jgi:hypothetical protein
MYRNQDDKCFSLIPFKSTTSGRATLKGHDGQESLYEKKVCRFRFLVQELSTGNGKRGTINGKIQTSDASFLPFFLAA